MTHLVLEDRSRAHLMLAAGSTGPQRCEHVRAAYDFASLASNSELVRAADKMFEDTRCPLEER